MHVHEVTETEIKQKRRHFEAVKQIECQISFHQNGVSTLDVALLSAREALFEEAKQAGAHVLVFEPYVTLSGREGESTLILSARAYMYASEEQ